MNSKRRGQWERRGERRAKPPPKWRGRPPGCHPWTGIAMALPLILLPAQKLPPVAVRDQGKPPGFPFFASPPLLVHAVSTSADMYTYTPRTSPCVLHTGSGRRKARQHRCTLSLVVPRAHSGSSPPTPSTSAQPVGEGEMERGDSGEEPPRTPERRQMSLGASQVCNDIPTKLDRWRLRHKRR